MRDEWRTQSRLFVWVWERLYLSGLRFVPRPDWERDLSRTRVLGYETTKPLEAGATEHLTRSSDTIISSSERWHDQHNQRHWLACRDRGWASLLLTPSPTSFKGLPSAFGEGTPLCGWDVSPSDLRLWMGLFKYFVVFYFVFCFVFSPSYLSFWAL